jgi:hypothetical protein
MSNVPPSRKPEATVAVVPAEKSPGNIEGITPPPALPPEHQRIRDAICRVAEHTNTPTSAKGMLLEYLRFIGPRLMFPDFPVTLKEHPTNLDNAAGPFASLTAGFIHHAASTIKAYEFVHVIQKGKTKLDEAFKQRLHEAEMLLSKRIRHLEALAQAWPSVHQHPDSGPARGYSLITSEQKLDIELKKREKDAVNA